MSSKSISGTNTEEKPVKKTLTLTDKELSELLDQISGMQTIINTTIQDISDVKRKKELLASMV